MKPIKRSIKGQAIPCASDQATIPYVTPKPIAAAIAIGFKFPDVSPEISGRYLTDPASFAYEPNVRTEARTQLTKRERTMDAICLLDFVTAVNKDNLMGIF